MIFNSTRYEFFYLMISLDARAFFSTSTHGEPRDLDFVNLFYACQDCGQFIFVRIERGEDGTLSFSFPVHFPDLPSSHCKLYLEATNAGKLSISCECSPLNETDTVKTVFALLA